MPARWKRGVVLAVPAAVLLACQSFSSDLSTDSDGGTEPDGDVSSPDPTGGDAASADAARPCREMAFGPLIPLSVNTAVDELTGRFNGDQTALYFAQSQVGTGLDLMTAKRLSDGGFATPEHLGLTTSAGIELAPTFADPSELVFVSYRSGSPRLYVSKNAGAPAALRNGDTQPDKVVYAPNPLALYVTREVPLSTATVSSRLFVRGRLAVSDQFDDGVVVQGADLGAMPESDAVVTPDELVLYFKRMPNGDESGRIHRATRPSKAVPFGAAIEVPELNRASSQAPTWISPDECTLLLSARESDGTANLYMARRGP